VPGATAAPAEGIGQRSGEEGDADNSSAQVPAVTKLLLASEGRPISSAAVDLAATIALRSNAPVHVFSIARIWGTSFGFPNPGLMPNQHEWREQREIINAAMKALQKRGVAASAGVVGTRQGAKRIVAEATRLGCDMIVMGADPKKGLFVRDMMWSQEPYRVERRAKIPVRLVVEQAKPGG